MEKIVEIMSSSLLHHTPHTTGSEYRLRIEFFITKIIVLN